MRRFLPAQILIMLYNTLILPHLSYCNIVWGNSSAANLNKLHILQKRVVRYITNAERCEHSAPLFKNLDLLNIFDIYRYQLGSFMYKCVNNMLPHTFCNFYTTSGTMHSYNTRNADKLYNCPVRSNVFQNSVRCNGSKLWNSLSNVCIHCTSLAIFKSHYKSILLHNYI